MKGHFKIVRTRYIPATETKGARIAVEGCNGRVYYPYPYESLDPHRGCALLYSNTPVFLWEAEDATNKTGKTFAFWATR